ncbi:M20 metallopeptidase family protein [Salisediminibacterium halotolerans]|uniref:M20 metallopeptidase family protein n=1 Tax=Salisediminibacterium halotolerans TaxID=517425 RepID=UPI000EB33F95|nr:amidohydrolase [Salisediminibacterium halotolerans]RLJ75679.1 amidohydrolase [Actinophytocola xinjiangensis]RPE89533.1 amidohydrolase [Salisediminibacterium halotolerans]TWG36292.1 amidohydrolase [Salisediminibacterium halotolerans]GEL09058.1 peptidase M20 [Salisediminibacterium halotolerans]
MNVKEAVLAYEDRIIALRREFHQYPEVSTEEAETSKRIQAELDRLGISYQTGFADTGVLAVIEGAHPGKTVALRADIDALPIEEKNQHAYVSKVPGKMHACGHDAHTAMLLGAGAVLAEKKAELEGTVLLVFQPAEENAPVGGADQMIADGVFDEYPPDAIFAQHCWPDLPVGQIGVRPGAMMGNSDRFTITIRGRSGHASMPHQTADAIVIANQVISALQTIVSRNADPLKSAVVTIGKIDGGSRYNVIAEHVTLEGTVRTYDEAMRALIKSKMTDLAEGIAQSMGGSAEVDYLDGYPATMNDPFWSGVVKDTAETVLGDDAAPEIEPSMGGEDFGKFLLQYPGAYFWLGTAIASRDVQKPLHDPEFDIDEKALAIGAEMMTQVAVNALMTLNAGEDINER